jgi:hypothetical protein
MFKARGLVENLSLPMNQLLREVLQDGLVASKTKELLIFKSTLESDGEYGVAQFWHTSCSIFSILF